MTEESNETPTPGSTDYKDALYALRMELQSEISKTREFAIERSDKARNAALGALSVVFAVIGMLSYQNLLSTVATRAETEIKDTTQTLESELLARVKKHIDSAVVEFKTTQGDQLRPAAGSTQQLKDAWKPTVDWGGGNDQLRAVIHIDISNVGFADRPIVLVSSNTPSSEESKASQDLMSLEAQGGSLSVENVTTGGFDVFLHLKDPVESDGTGGKGPAAKANFYGWYFNWIALGKAPAENAEP